MKTILLLMTMILSLSTANAQENQILDRAMIMDLLKKCDNLSAQEIQSRINVLNKPALQFENFNLINVNVCQDTEKLAKVPGHLFIRSVVDYNKLDGNTQAVAAPLLTKLSDLTEYDAINHGIDLEKVLTSLYADGGVKTSAHRDLLLYAANFNNRDCIPGMNQQIIDAVLAEDQSLSEDRRDQYFEQFGKNMYECGRIVTTSAKSQAKQ